MGQTNCSLPHRFPNLDRFLYDPCTLGGGVDLNRSRWGCFRFSDNSDVFGSNGDEKFAFSLVCRIRNTFSAGHVAGYGRDRE